MKCEDIEILVSGYIDGELTQQEGQRVRLHLEDCPGCRRNHAELLRVREAMQQLSYPESDQQLLARLEADITARATRGIGWILLVTGGLLITGFLLFGFIADPGIPLAVKLFYGLFMVGGSCLFISVLRQRLMTYKNDKYRKIKL